MLRLLGVGDLNDELKVNMPMQSTFGGHFGDAFNEEDVIVEDWGNVTFQFGECDDASYTWEAPAPFHTGGYELSRLTALRNISC